MPSATSLYALEMEFLGMNKTRIRAAGYPRVSDEGLADSKTLESQEKEIREYIAKMRYELTEDRMYPEAKSAYLVPFRQRKRFVELLEAAKRGEFDVVVVTEYNRLDRRQVQQAVIIDILESYGVKVESVTEKFDDSPIGNFMRAVYAFIAEVEREKTLYRTSRAKKHRAQENLTGQGEPRYGYTYIDTDDYERARYLIDTEVIYMDAEGILWTRATVVRFIHTSIQQGKSLRSIAITLTEMGIPSPRGKSYWSVTTVDYIAKDKWYTGKDLTVYYYERHGKKVTKRPTEEQIKLPDGIVPPIITVECYQATQEQLARNKQFSMRNNQHPKDTGILRGGLCKCGICGYTMIVSHPMRSYKEQTNIPVPPKYVCGRRDGVEDIKHHHYVTIFVHLLDKQAWELATAYIRQPNLIRERVAKIIAQHKPTDTLEDVKASIANLNRKINNLIRLAEDVTDDNELTNIKGRMVDLQKQKRELTILLNEVAEEQDLQEELERELQRFEQWTAKVRPLLDDPDFKPSYEEMQTACVILGVTAKVFPDKPEYPTRIQLEVAPPKLMQIVSKTSGNTSNCLNSCSGDMSWRMATCSTLMALFLLSSMPQRATGGSSPPFYRRSSSANAGA